MISSPSPASISPRSSPPSSSPHPYLDLLPLFSLYLISPACPVLSSSFPISLSSTPASSRQFQISVKAAARRLDAYCCYRNRPSVLDYNVTLSPRQGYNVCLVFMSDQIQACISFSVCLPECTFVLLVVCDACYFILPVAAQSNFKIPF